jgi:hypothetical protein
MLRSALLLCLLAAAPALAAGKGAAAGKHPAGGGPADPDACLSCHSEKTPEVVKQWEGGAHGLVLVKCFVCHGSTGKDFAARPQGGRRCEGCHAAEVASVTPAKGKAQSCFACHAPHALSAVEGRKSPHTAQ